MNTKHHYELIKVFRNPVVRRLFGLGYDIRALIRMTKGSNIPVYLPGQKHPTKRRTDPRDHVNIFFLVRKV